MSLKDAKKKFAPFQFSQQYDVKRYRSFLGKTADPFEIKLNFYQQDDGSEILHYINIAQADHTKICQERKALGKAYSKAQMARFRKSTPPKDITTDIKNNKKYDDEMLMYWARHCKPWNDYSESQFIDYASWLMKATPNQRHVAALNWNWDYGEAPPIWICRKSDTDIATAISVFFLFEPSYYLKFLGKIENVDNQRERFMFKNILDIKMKIESGFYTNSNIFLDLESKFTILRKYNKDLSQLQHTIPVNLKQKYTGVKLEPNSLGIPDFGIN